ncbi:GNAT family N-acetyltransferase [Clostridium saccharoperbutylacetonicum]|uniref:GNAT family N-acetyltransferase n=1 Tax=Clostridium saccharoperbutylacetonicum TaxID=36745 RepID=UPI0009840357|nr:GNAT family N-acetyltransferase [Clostridium saccharoperbutylacetonicum]AQR94045.1 hypothetical protein CLSAP_13520 [Clostridium saccharoperbutylacetonicum]NSB29744.1 RimJ/RimL family protein N-acetyltransferase [Clostridium saccharoperbutylacetonicum]
MRSLESDRLILRNWRISDLEDYHEISSNKKVSDLAGFRLKTNKVESLNTLEKFIAVSDDSKWEMKLKELNQLVFWAIELKEISRSIGWFELCEATWKVEEEKFKYAKEIGFVLGEEYWGQGLMPEAIKLVLNYLFEEGIQVVMCSHFINNSQSEKVIKKCGFKFYREDDEEKYYYFNGIN